MANEEEIAEEAAPKASKMPLILGLVLSLVGGGAGFYAGFSGLIPGFSEGDSKPVEAKAASPLGDITFVPVDPLIVGISRPGGNAHLRFRAELEVPAKYQEDVTLVMPRIVDVLNGYLRAVDTEDLENPAALSRLRAQMLRRVALVAGRERVNDLLVMEFVIN